MELLQLSDSELAGRDVALVNLLCAEGLPGAEELDIAACLARLDEWAALVDLGTRRMLPRFHESPGQYWQSEACFRILVMTTVLQRNVGLTYNFAFLEGDYDASDSRNLFIHGPLNGWGGTCVTLPIIFTAVGRRLGYPIKIIEAREHLLCRWDGPDGKRFNFEAAGQGFEPRDDNFYRRWPQPISEQVIRENGFLRSFSPRDELALSTIHRPRCLMDNMHFLESLEMFYHTGQLAPEKKFMQAEWATSSLVYLIATRMAALGYDPDKIDRLDSAAYEALVRRATAEPTVEWERNLLPVAHGHLFRIHRNRAKRRTQTAKPDVFAEMYRQSINKGR